MEQEVALRTDAIRSTLGNVSEKTTGNDTRLTPILWAPESGSLDDFSRCRLAQESPPGAGARWSLVRAPWLCPFVSLTCARVSPLHGLQSYRLPRCIGEIFGGRGSVAPKEPMQQKR